MVSTKEHVSTLILEPVDFVSLHLCALRHLFTSLPLPSTSSYHEP